MQRELATIATLMVAIAISPRAVAGEREQARAVERSGRVWLEASPWTCAAHLPALAREIALACDAAGGACAIAPNEDAANRRVVLRCDEHGPFAAEESGDTVARWSLDLTGTVSDRLRRVAIGVVRAETDELAPAAAEPVAAIVPPPPLAVAAPVDTAQASPWTGDGVTLAGAGRGLVAFVDDTSPASGRRSSGSDSSSDSSSGLGMLGGGGGTTAIAGTLVSGLKIGVAGTYERMTSGRTSLGAGGLLAFGAPFDATRFGASLEIGGVSTNLHDRSGHRLAPYMRGAVTVQLFPTGRIRPYTSLGYGVMTEAVIHFASLDVGIAWSP